MLLLWSRSKSDGAADPVASAVPVRPAGEVRQVAADVRQGAARHEHAVAATVGAEVEQVVESDRAHVRTVTRLEKDEYLWLICANKLQDFFYTFGLGVEESGWFVVVSGWLVVVSGWFVEVSGWLVVVSG